MGLFTQEAKTDYSVPLFARLAAKNKQSQRQFTDQYLDPFIKENIGYESPRMKMKSIAQGVDLSDGKAVQKAYMEIQAINPQEAQGWLESIKPVIAQQLDSLKIKEAQLKFNKAKNKPLVKQRWDLEGRPNFIASHVATNFAGLEGVDDLLASIKSEPKRARMYVNTFLNSMEKSANKTAIIKEYKELLKEAETNYYDIWLPKDTSDTSDTSDFTEPKVDTRKTGDLKDTGGSDTPSEDSLYKADPERSQLRQGFGEVSSSMALWKVLQSVQGDLTSFMPEFLMTDAELKLENIRDDIGDWIGDWREFGDGGATAYFKKRPYSEVLKFKEDPVKYWNTNKPKGK